MRKLHAFVRDRHPGAVCLETVAVSRALVDQLEAVADGAVAEASWFEVMPWDGVSISFPPRLKIVCPTKTRVQILSANA